MNTAEGASKWSKKGAAPASAGRQKTKKPSTLKKKILQERYRLFQEKKELETYRREQLEMTASAALPTEKRRMFPIFVFGLTEGIDLSDADELQEMINNIKELFSDFSDICSIRIHRTPDDSLICEEYTSLVILAFQDESSADNAVAIMNGRIIGGDRLLVVKPTFDDALTGKPTATQSSDQGEIEAVLILKNVFTMEEIVEGDEDNLQETCQDILSLCQPYDGATQVYYWPNTSQSDNQRLSSLLSKDNVCHDVLSMTAFRSALVEHWRQSFQRAKPAPIKDNAKAKPTRTPPAQLRQQKALRQFNKPLVHITFHMNLGVQRCLHQTGWFEHVASPWYAVYAASLLHDLQIGGEVLRTYALLQSSSMSASTVLLPLFEGPSKSTGSVRSPDGDVWTDTCHWSLCLHSDQPQLTTDRLQDTAWTQEASPSSSVVETTWQEASVMCRSVAFVEIWHRWRDALRVASPGTTTGTATITIRLHAPSLPSPVLIYAATTSSGTSTTSSPVVDPLESRWDLALCIENYLTADDLTGDHEEICATKQDLLQIWKDQASMKADTACAEADFAQLMRHIRRVAIVSPIATVKKPRAGSRVLVDDDDDEGEGEGEGEGGDVTAVVPETNDGTAADESISHDHMDPVGHGHTVPVTGEAASASLQECLVYVPYQRHEGAIAAMCYFDGLLLGGVPVTACCLIVPPRDEEALLTINVDDTAAVERHVSQLEALELSRQRLNSWIQSTFPSSLDINENLTAALSLSVVFREDADVVAVGSETLTTADDDDDEEPRGRKAKKGGKKKNQDATAAAAAATDSTASATASATAAAKGGDANGGDGDGDGDGGAITSTLRPRKISLYRIARAVPKLETRSSESIAHHIPMATAEINTYTKQLLQQLASYQRKLHTKLMTEVPPFPIFPPSSSQMTSAKARKQQAIALQEFADGQRRKFKAKIRFVCGLRQVTQGVKAGRVKMVLLAPNTEASVALDSKVLYLIRCATALNIPVMYALSRRLLGAALEMTIKQSCVGICSAEGAGYDLFRKMLDFVHREALTMSTAAVVAVDAAAAAAIAGATTTTTAIDA